MHFPCLRPLLLLCGDVIIMSWDSGQWSGEWPLVAPVIFLAWCQGAPLLLWTMSYAHRLIGWWRELYQPKTYCLSDRQPYLLWRERGRGGGERGRKEDEQKHWKWNGKTHWNKKPDKWTTKCLSWYWPHRRWRRKVGGLTSLQIRRKTTLQPIWAQWNIHASTLLKCGHHII